MPTLCRAVATDKRGGAEAREFLQAYRLSRQHALDDATEQCDGLLRGYLVCPEDGFVKILSIQSKVLLSPMRCITASFPSLPSLGELYAVT